MLPRIILALSLIIGPTVVRAAENRVTGTVISVICGDATNFELRLGSKRRLQGVCYETWCDQLCGERASRARARMIGRKLSTSVRVVNTEEPESGAIANEFFNITLE